MQRAIAIETSGRLGSVAIVEDAIVVAEEAFQHGLANAAQLVPILDRLLQERGWLPAQLDHVYVSAGPGSFTGLRIGITLAKTLALTTHAKIVAVPSVHVLAENAPEDARHLVVVLDAKRGQIFTARFERVETQWVERLPAQLDTLANMIETSPKPVHLLGDGIPFHRDAIDATATGAGDVIVTDEASWRARAAVVARLGAQMASEGRYADPMTLTPIYIRRPEAEEKFEARGR